MDIRGANSTFYFYNNYIYSNTWARPHVDAYSSTDATNLHMYFWNNTLVDGDGASSCINYEGETIEVRNNLCISDVTPISSNNVPDSLIMESNVFMSRAESEAAEYNEANHYTPTNGTEIIGQGTNLTAFFTTDFTGATRPATGAWTIGAYEGAGEGTPTTPSNVRVISLNVRTVQLR